MYSFKHDVSAFYKLIFQKKGSENNQWMKKLVFMIIRLFIFLIIPLIISCSTTKSLYKWQSAGFCVIPETVPVLGRIRHSSIGPSNYYADWEKAGFNNPQEAKEWREAGFYATNAIKWKNAKFKPEEAKSWIGKTAKGSFVFTQNQDFNPKDAAKWRKAGFKDSRTAKRWLMRHFNPETAKKWHKAGFENPHDALIWEKAFYDPLNAIKWTKSGFSPSKSYKWQIAGFSSEEAKKWKEFEPDYAKEWKEQGFSPADAEEWFKGGFDFKGGVLAAKKWKEFGLSLKTGYAAEILSLDVNDIPVDSVLLLPKNKSLKDIPPEIIGLLSVCKANKLNFHNHLNSMKAFIEEECSNQFEKYHSDIFKRNPYEIVGKCFGIDGKIFQLLDKSTGLFKVKFKSSQLVFLDFKDKYAPVMDFSAFIKGVDPLQYKALLGSHKIVPSFEVHWFVKISPDLNFS